jgi:hypothetical protein
MAESRQRLLIDLGGELSEGAPRKRSQPSRVNGHAVDTSIVVAEIERLAARLLDRFERLESEVAQLRELLRARTIEKEYYSTKEAAQLLGKRPYTVREWCRLGRINSVKTLSGRGIDEEWRVSHEEILRIQNEGLLQIKPGTKICAVPRLPR